MSRTPMHDIYAFRLIMWGRSRDGDDWEPQDAWLVFNFVDHHITVRHSTEDIKREDLETVMISTSEFSLFKGQIEFTEEAKDALEKYPFLVEPLRRSCFKVDPCLNIK